MKSRLFQWLAACGPVGFIPVAPGTWGSVVACLLVFFLPAVFGHLLVVSVVVCASALLLTRVEAAGADPGFIVIDEVAGMLVALCGHDAGGCTIAKGFILFRAFDILKPYPIRKLERLPGALGVVADDVGAGLLANAALVLLSELL